tara:strand:- start:355 stop:873 length:519 start_codon:yes stop_codon:yes gene_type:complete
MPLPIWSPSASPKRKYQFLLNIAGIPTAIVKSVTRPKVAIGQSEHKFLVHKFKYPGQVTWEDLKIEITDWVDLDASVILMNVIRNSGYVLPSNFDPNPASENYQNRTPSKRNAINSLGIVSINTTDEDGNVVENWKLHNVWIKGVSFDDASYDSEDILGISIDLSFDWAELE